MIPRQISANGLNLIKQFEGCKLTSYQDSVGVWTVGYGSTSCVDPHITITQAQADARLKEDVQHAVECVDRKVGPNLTQNQFDALVSFVFNVGGAAFSTSAMLRHLNAGEFQQAALEFPKWDHAGAVELEGLRKRRLAEQALFNARET
jgi:lysozyme